MEELYGDFDPLSQSWTDGLASTIMREYVNLENFDKKWVNIEIEFRIKIKLIFLKKTKQLGGV